MPASDKHPLENKWTLWHDPGQQGGKTAQHDYGQQMDRVYTFDTVEDFWWCAAPTSSCTQRLYMHAAWQRCHRMTSRCGMTLQQGSRVAQHGTRQQMHRMFTLDTIENSWVVDPGHSCMQRLVDKHKLDSRRHYDEKHEAAAQHACRQQAD